MGGYMSAQEMNQMQENTNYYQGTTTVPNTGGYTFVPYPQPNHGICPGCGRCRDCGRPYETQPPYPWITYTTSGTALEAFGQGALDNHTTGTRFWDIT